MKTAAARPPFLFVVVLFQRARFTTAPRFAGSGLGFSKFAALTKKT
jgi:hypothetical protein